MILEVDWQVDMMKAAEIVEDRSVFTGNVGPSYPLVHGTPFFTSWLDSFRPDLHSRQDDPVHLVGSRGAGQGGVGHRESPADHGDRKDVIVLPGLGMQAKS